MFLLIMNRTLCRAIPVGYGRSKLGVWGATVRQQSVLQDIHDHDQSISCQEERYLFLFL